MLAAPSPNHLQPSPSPTQSTFASLRKMPSSLFHRNDSSAKRSLTAPAPSLLVEPITSVVPTKEKKSRMGLGILNWGSNTHSQGKPFAPQRLPQYSPIETVRSVGEAFGRTQADRDNSVRESVRMCPSGVPPSLPTKQPLNDLEKTQKASSRFTGVAGIARRASNLSLKPRLSPDLPCDPVTASADRRPALEPIARPANQRRSSNSSSVVSNASNKKLGAKTKTGVAGVWRRITGGKKRSVKEEIEAQMQPQAQVVKLKDEEAQDRKKPVKLSFASSRYSGGNQSTLSTVSAATSNFTHVATPSSIPVLSISRPSFEGILSRPLLYDENANYASPALSHFGLPQEHMTTLPPPLRARSRGASSMRPAGGVWESVVGDLVFEDVLEEASTENQYAFQKAVPKRKSLSGLFSHFGSPIQQQDPIDQEPAEQDVLSTPAKQIRDRKVRSEQWGLGDSVKKKLDSSKKQVGIDHVASATHSLFDLVNRFDLSATPSPAGNNAHTHSHKRSPDVPVDVTASPTPMRRAASLGSSALLSGKHSGSPLKVFAKGGLSPFKVAMSKAMALRHFDDSPARTTPDNIFAPTNLTGDSVKRRSKGPSPRPKLPLVFAPASQLAPVSQRGIEEETIGMPSRPYVNLVIDELVGMGMTMGPAFAHEQHEGSDSESENDVPGDLRVILSDSDMDATDMSLASALEATVTMGLPPPPSLDRISPRRPAPNNALPVPPSAALPPSPCAQSRARAPQLSLDLAFKEGVRESFFSDRIGSVCSDDFTVTGHERTSFDFTREFADLNGNGQRTSFLEQVEKMGNNPLLLSSQVVAKTSSVNDLGGSLRPIEVTPVTPALPMLDYPTDFDEPRANKVSVGALNRDFKFGKASTSPGGAKKAAALELHQILSSASVDPRGTNGSHANAPRPFCGEPLFQKRMSQEKAASPSVAPPASMPELPIGSALDTLRPRAKLSSHARDESVFSIASMSSLGTVINTGIAGVFTNVFDADFARAIREADSQESTVASFEMIRSRPSASARHRRSFSIDSRGSIDGHSISIAGGGPPVSLYNRSRSSASKGHRRNMSTDSRSSAGSYAHGLGRPDWAAHRRNRSSLDSARSSISISRLGRPGLGDRMFNSDRGQLPSIMASPAGDSSAGDSNPRDSMASFDSLLDGCSTSCDSILDGNSGANDSIFDRSDAHAKSSSISSDSVFGSTSHCTDIVSNGFALKGLRPLSTLSTLSGQAEDTFVNVGGTSKLGARFIMPASPTAPRRKGQAHPSPRKAQMAGRAQKSSSESGYCIPSHGFGFTFVKPAQDPSARSHLGHRRRPPVLNLQNDSESDVSNVLSPGSSIGSYFGSSIDLGPSIAIRARPRGSGHARGARSKSSAGVSVQATIFENHPYRTSAMPDLTMDTGDESEASSALPLADCFIESNSWSSFQGGKDLRVLKGWREWEREAGDVYRASKSSWDDSDESRSVVADFNPPISSDAIMRFIAASSETYVPLAQLPFADRMSHRRSSSLTNARAFASPYALPLPKPGFLPTKVKTSLPLPTKFERTNSATSSTFNFASAHDDAAPVQPPSAVFAKFVIPPPPPASPPPVLRDLDPISPLQVPHLGAIPLRPQMAKVNERNDAKDMKRSRVTSNARRQALGWGRRRASDGGPAESNVLAKTIRSRLAGVAENHVPLVTGKENEVIMTPPESLRLVRPRPRQSSSSRSGTKIVPRAPSSIRA